MKYFGKDLNQWNEEHGMRGAKKYAAQSSAEWKERRSKMTPEEIAEMEASLRRRELYGVMVWAGWAILIVAMIVCCATGKPDWLFEFFNG